METLHTLKNLPITNAENLASLLSPKTNQVVSMALSKSDNVQISLFTFADGEAVSEERYLGDTFYLLVEGHTRIKFADRTVEMNTGDILAVPAMVGHEIGGVDAFKVLQITILETN